MLIEKSYKANDVISLRTETTEIVGRLKEEGETTITLAKPMSVMVTPEGVGLGPLFFTVEEDKDVVIHKSSIIAGPLATRDDFAKSYIQNTTGLTI